MALLHDMEARRCHNLCTRGQDRRLRVGVVGFVGTLALAIAFAKAGAPPMVRWLLAVPFFVAIVAVAQALTGTCSYLASRGLRDRGEGKEIIIDPEELHLIRARGRRILMACVAIALIAAGLFAQIGGA